WNTTLFADGLYNLTAISWDQNNIYTSNDTELQIEIDNTAPSAPVLTPLPAFDSDGTASLNWTDVSLSHSDVIYYNVYRSTTQNFNISSSTRIKNVSTNFTSDIPGADAKYYYKVTAVDNALHESGASNEENTTIATGRIFGILAVNDSIVADSGIVKFTFSAPRLGLNVTINASQLGNLDSNSVELMLNDSGQNGDDKVDDGVYTAVYAISSANTVADGRKTITAIVNDSANNRFFPSVNITLDNTIPNASIRIQGLGTTGLSNVSTEYTTSRNIILSLLYNDSEGIDLCRYANEDLVFTLFEPCEAAKAWILSANDGNKTVLYEVRDHAGNVNRTNDTIALNTTGAGLDQTPPSAPTVTDDGTYTNTKHALHARWNSSDPENDILHISLQYEYRISYNSSNSFVNGSAFLLVGTATEVRVFGLSLDNNTNYTFEVRAINTAGIRSPTGYSDGIIVDITPPTAPGIVSNHSSNWTQNSNPTFNWSSNDSISGVKAYSYVLDTNFSTIPDNVEESETEHILVNSSVNTGQQQTLKYNSTANASAIFIEVRQNLTALDTIRLTIYAAESHVETPDTMKISAYAISSPPTAYNMTASNITTISDTTTDIAFKQSLLDADGTVLSITSSANVTAGRFYIAIAGAAEDDDNNYNLLITGSNVTASIDNATQSFICFENGACTNQTNTFDYGVKIERADLRGDNIWDRSYSVGDGKFYFHAKAIDNAGTWGETSTYNISVDTSAPSTPQMSQPAKTTNNNSIAFEWTQSTDPHSGVDNYYLTADNDSDFSSPDYRNWVGNVTNATITVTNTSTTYYARVHSKNLAGVNSSLSSSVSTILDITPPTVTYIRPSGTIVSSSATLAARTSERATCRYQIGAGTTQNFTFTNNTYHETSVSLITGDTISVTCYDDVSNAGTASSGTITVSALSADSVTLVPTTKTVFTDEATSIDYTVKSGSTNLGGITSDSFSLFLDTSSQAISVTDNGNGNYTIAFTSPATNGSMNMTGRVGTTTSAQGTLNVNNLMFTVLFVNDTLNPIKTQKMTYTLVGNNFSLGIASQSKSVSIGSSAATGLNLTANAKDSDVMVFVTRPTSGVERVEDLLKDREFLDAVVPSFGYALKQDTFIVYTELSYSSIALSSNSTLSTGRHNLVIENRGFDTTINKTKLEVRIT
ncbi:hypothetical protein HYV82_05885, partial [Candidatus Woesearchaeota archaeon]|nr:hypothetical protein [Candidatus Woesearchaeota archaeon]